METDGDSFAKVGAEELNQLAQQQGFKRKGQRKWLRRTADFVQLVNVQRSQWSSEDQYLNFALWALAFGEPPSIAESEFHFRTRAEDMGATDLASFFSCANELSTLVGLHAANASKRIAGMMTKDLRALLLQS
jgi:hypothetical protein